jgi:hypothetical protein
MNDVLPGRNFVMNVKSGDHVVEHTELLEKAYLLECPCKPQSHAPMRAHTREILAIKRD